MKKRDILVRLEELGFDRNDYWVITGSAMVLYGIRENTHDIDLGCTSALADRLEQQGFPTSRMEDGTRKITIGDDIEIFENWIYGTVQDADGVPVISLDGLIGMKRALGREKDLRDIRLIEDFTAGLVTGRPVLKICNDLGDYLKASRYIDFENSSISEKARTLFVPDDEIETVRNTYHFVRDGIRHSWDVQDKRVTVAASDVLREKVGICWAKANLLAALLRANRIPAGICYQRLTLGDTPDTGYCIHALNAVYLKSLGRWIRLDARGNKEGVNAQMCLDAEKLAFPVRPELGEIDYREVYAEPSPITMEVLENNSDALYMYLNALPDRL